MALAPTPLASSLARMRLFYNLFPYPNRPFVALPDVRSHGTAHAGFARLLAQDDVATAHTVWKANASRRTSLAPLTETLGALERLDASFPSPLRIGLVGCGTDEPVLMRLLHPRNPIDALDLSARSLVIARGKLAFAHVVRALSPGRPGLRGGCRFVACEAASFLETSRAGSYAHLQCFGVLHHQENPSRLLAAMARSLAPGGTLRLMVYSHHGRRLERRIQSRYLGLWESLVARASTVARIPALVRLGVESAKLRLWRIASAVGRGGTGTRFRYLASTGPYLADAFLHPSDPGLPLPEVRALAEAEGLRLVFCEGKVEEHGRLSGLGAGLDSEGVWERLAAADARGALLSNVIAIFRKA